MPGQASVAHKTTTGRSDRVENAAQGPPGWLILGSPVDDSLRRAERNTQGGEERAGLLSELLRAGRLSEHDLRLAAYAGDPAAGRILGTADNQAGSPGAEEWLAGLRRWGYPALIAAALGLLTLRFGGLPRASSWRREPSQFATLLPSGSVLQALRPWLPGPCLRGPPVRLRRKRTIMP